MAFRKQKAADVGIDIMRRPKPFNPTLIPDNSPELINGWEIWHETVTQADQLSALLAGQLVAEYSTLSRERSRQALSLLSNMALSAMVSGYPLHDWIFLENQQSLELAALNK